MNSHLILIVVSEIYNLLDSSLCCQRVGCWSLCDMLQRRYVGLSPEVNLQDWDEDRLLTRYQDWIFLDDESTFLSLPMPPLVLGSPLIMAVRGLTILHANCAKSFVLTWKKFKNNEDFECQKSEWSRGCGVVPWCSPWRFLTKIFPQGRSHMSYWTQTSHTRCHMLNVRDSKISVLSSNGFEQRASTAKIGARSSAATPKSLQNSRFSKGSCSQTWVAVVLQMASNCRQQFILPFNVGIVIILIIFAKLCSIF